MKKFAEEPKDIAHWITVSMLKNSRAPNVLALQTRYSMSLATAYRWRNWAVDKMCAMRASQR